MSKTLHYDFASDKSLVARIGPTLTCTRASEATYFDSTGTRQVAAANEARFDHDPNTLKSLGLLVEEARTNLFLNSDAPVTQGVTTTAQTYTVWMEGSGSVTLSGTGTGVATDGSPVTVTCTAGTLTLTVAGGPDLVQVEDGEFPSSYIPTVGSPVTRANEDIKTLDVTWYNEEEGSLYTRGSIQHSFTSSTVVSINSGSTANRLGCWRSGGLANSYLVQSGGVVQVNMSEASKWTADGVEHAFMNAAKLNDFISYFDGVQSGTPDTSGIMPLLISRMNVGAAAGGAVSFHNGHIAEIAYFDERLPNTVLADYSANGLPGEDKFYLAVTRRTASQMRPKQRMPRTRRGTLWNQ